MPINNFDENVESLDAFTADLTDDDNLLVYGGLGIDTGSIGTFDGATHGTESFVASNIHDTETTFGTRTFIDAGGHILDADILTGSQTFTQNTSGSVFDDTSFHMTTFSDIDQTNPQESSPAPVTYNLTTPGAINFTVPSSGAIAILQVTTNVNAPTTPSGWTVRGANKSLDIISDYRIYTREYTSGETTSVTPVMDGDGTGRGYARVTLYKLNDSGASVVSQDVSQAQTIDEPTLTQHHVLSVDDITQAQSIDEPTLTQAHVLATDDVDQAQTIDNVDLVPDLQVDEITQAQSIDEPDLTQHNVLATDDINSAHSIDNVGLTPDLEVDEITQEQTIDNVTLSIAALDVDDINSAHSIDEPILTQAHVLSVDAILNAQTLDSPTITQSHVLAVDDMSQLQTLDNVVLSVFSGLVTQDLLQGQTIDEPNLTQHNVLATDDITQAQLIDNINLIQFHILATQGLLQSQTLDNATVTEGNIQITPDDLLQAQTIGESVLVQAHVLAVDDLTQAQLIDNVSLNGIVVGSFKGDLFVFSAYNGEIVATNVYTGVTKIL